MLALQGAAGCCRRVYEKLWKQRKGQTEKILVLGGLGTILGYVFRPMSGAEGSVIVQYLTLPGDLWTKCITMVVPMLLFTNLSTALGEMKSQPGAVEMGKILFLWWVLTSIAAAGIGVLVATCIIIPCIKQTENFRITSNATGVGPFLKVAVDSTLQPTEAVKLLVPSNFIAAVKMDDLISVGMVAVVVGLILVVPNRSKEVDEGAGDEHEIENKYGLYGALAELNIVCMRATHYLVLFTPFAIFSLMIESGATLSLKGIAINLGILYGSIVGGLLFFSFVVLPVLFFLFTGSSVYPHLKNFRKIGFVAFSTSSSIATLPVNITLSIEKLGVHPSIAKLVCSVGASLNMNGTTLSNIVIASFITQSRGFQMTLTAMLKIAADSILLAAVSPPVPGGGKHYVNIARHIGAGIAGKSSLQSLILGLDWISDRSSTVVNVVGDYLACYIIQTYAVRRGLLKELDWARKSMDL